MDLASYAVVHECRKGGLVKMEKRSIVRIELLLLGILAVLLLSRVFKSLPLLDGEVTINDISRADLEHKAFTISSPTEVTISAFGSLESTEYGRSSEATMAAYPWIVRRSDRKLIWRMDPSNAETEEGTLLRTENSVSLQPGIYDLYYASYGSTKRSARDRRFLGLRLGEHWTADRKRWQVALRASSGQLSEIDGDLDSYSPAVIDNLIWTSGTMRNRKNVEQILVVDSPITVSIYSIGEICSDANCGDYGMIENVATRAEVWRLSAENAKPAGGSETNFVFDGSVTLDEGIYRVSYKTDAGHAYGGWHGNPPFDPTAWGMTLYGADERVTQHVRPFDIWTERQPVIKLAPARSGADLQQSFTVNSTTDVLLYAMGEIDGDSRYDYGWLENLDSGEIVWTMNRDVIRHAGGSHDNSLAEAYLTLDPGQYELKYTSDDSHAYGDWRRDRPDHEERWGITLFSLSDDQSGAISMSNAISKPQARGEMHNVSGEEVFSLVGAENNQSMSRSLELTKSRTLHIRAIGEISQSGEYDFGWIQTEPDEKIVWKMGRTNTISAGGDERFRLFDDLIALDEGVYSIHFETDESHAYGDFRDASPEFESEYGMRVVLLSE